MFAGECLCEVDRSVWGPVGEELGTSGSGLSGYDDGAAG